MRQLSKILLAGIVAFLMLGMLQKWDFFLGAWLGESNDEKTMSRDDLLGAAATVEDLLTLMRHYYASGGDPRFAERMPASDGVLAEMTADVEYLMRAGRRQEPVLQELEILDLRPLGEIQVEVRTKEYWIHHLEWIEGRGPAEEIPVPPRSQILYGRYFVVLGSTGWRVEATEFVPDEELETLLIPNEESGGRLPGANE